MRSERNLAYAAGAQEGRQPAVFHPLMNLPFSLRKHGGNQRAETIKERQSGYHSVYCAKYAQFTDSVLLHISESLRRGRHGYAAQRITPAITVWHALSDAEETLVSV